MFTCNSSCQIYFDSKTCQIYKILLLQYSIVATDRIILILAVVNILKRHIYDFISLSALVVWQLSKNHTSCKCWNWKNVILWYFDDYCQNKFKEYCFYHMAAVRHVLTFFKILKIAVFYVRLLPEMFWCRCFSKHQKGNVSMVLLFFRCWSRWLQFILIWRILTAMPVKFDEYCFYNMVAVRITFFYIIITVL